MATYTHIATIETTSATSSIVFNNISQSFRDLIFHCDMLGTVSSDYVYMRVNGNASSAYSNLEWYGNSSQAVYSFSFLPMSWNSTSLNSTYRTQAVAEFLDYSDSNKHLTVLTQYGNGGNGYNGADSGRYKNTAAITRVDFLTSSANFAAGTKIHMFGIEA